MSGNKKEDMQSVKGSKGDKLDPDQAHLVTKKVAGIHQQGARQTNQADDCNEQKVDLESHEALKECKMAEIEQNAAKNSNISTPKAANNPLTRNNQSSSLRKVAYINNHTNQTNENEEHKAEIESSQESESDDQEQSNAIVRQVLENNSDAKSDNQVDLKVQIIERNLGAKDQESDAKIRKSFDSNKKLDEMQKKKAKKGQVKSRATAQQIPTYSYFEDFQRLNDILVGKGDNQSDCSPSRLKGKKGSESRKKSLKKKRFSANLGAKTDLNPHGDLNRGNFDSRPKKKDIRKLTLKAKSIQIEKVFQEKRGQVLPKSGSPSKINPLHDQRQSAPDYIFSSNAEAYQQITEETADNHNLKGQKMKNQLTQQQMSSSHRNKTHNQTAGRHLEQGDDLNLMAKVVGKEEEGTGSCSQNLTGKNNENQEYASLPQSELTYIEAENFKDMMLTGQGQQQLAAGFSSNNGRSRRNFSKSHTSTGGVRAGQGATQHQHRREEANLDKNSGHERSKTSLKSNQNQKAQDDGLSHQSLLEENRHHLALINSIPMKPGAMPRTAESISENSNVGLSQNLTFDLSGRVASRSRVITQSVTGEAPQIPPQKVTDIVVINRSSTTFAQKQRQQAETNKGKTNQADHQTFEPYGDQNSPKKSRKRSEIPQRYQNNFSYSQENPAFQVSKLAKKMITNPIMTQKTFKVGQKSDQQDIEGQTNLKVQKQNENDTLSIDLKQKQKRQTKSRDTNMRKNRRQGSKQGGTSQQFVGSKHVREVREMAKSSKAVAQVLQQSRKRALDNANLRKQKQLNQQLNQTEMIQQQEARADLDIQGAGVSKQRKEFVFISVIENKQKIDLEGVQQPLQANEKTDEEKQLFEVQNEMQIDMDQKRQIIKKLSNEQASFVDYAQNLPLPSFPDEFDLESVIIQSAENQNQMSGRPHQTSSDQLPTPHQHEIDIILAKKLLEKSNSAQKQNQTSNDPQYATHIGKNQEKCHKDTSSISPDFYHQESSSNLKQNSTSNITTVEVIAKRANGINVDIFDQVQVLGGMQSSQRQRDEEENQMRLNSMGLGTQQSQLVTHTDEITNANAQQQIVNQQNQAHHYQIRRHSPHLSSSYTPIENATNAAQIVRNQINPPTSMSHNSNTHSNLQEMRMKTQPSEILNKLKSKKNRSMHVSRQHTARDASDQQKLTQKEPRSSQMSQKTKKYRISARDNMKTVVEGKSILKEKMEQISKIESDYRKQTDELVALMSQSVSVNVSERERENKARDENEDNRGAEVAGSDEYCEQVLVAPKNTTNKKGSPNKNERQVKGKEKRGSVIKVEKQILDLATMQQQQEQQEQIQNGTLKLSSQNSRSITISRQQASKTQQQPFSLTNMNTNSNHHHHHHPSKQLYVESAHSSIQSSAMKLRSQYNTTSFNDQGEEKEGVIGEGTDTVQQSLALRRSEITEPEDQDGQSEQKQRLKANPAVSSLPNRKGSEKIVQQSATIIVAQSPKVVINSTTINQRAVDQISDQKRRPFQKEQKLVQSKQAGFVQNQGLRKSKDAKLRGSSFNRNEKSLEKGGPVLDVKHIDLANRRNNSKNYLKKGEKGTSKDFSILNQKNQASQNISLVKSQNSLQESPQYLNSQKTEGKVKDEFEILYLKDQNKGEDSQLKGSPNGEILLKVNDDQMHLLSDQSGTLSAKMRQFRLKPKHQNDQVQAKYQQQQHQLSSGKKSLVSSGLSQKQQNLLNPDLFYQNPKKYLKSPDSAQNFKQTNNQVGIVVGHEIERRVSTSKGRSEQNQMSQRLGFYDQGQVKAPTQYHLQGLSKEKQNQIQGNTLLQGADNSKSNQAKKHDQTTLEYNIGTKQKQFLQDSTNFDAKIYADDQHQPFEDNFQQTGSFITEMLHPQQIIGGPQTSQLHQGSSGGLNGGGGTGVTSQLMHFRQSNEDQNPFVSSNSKQIVLFEEPRTTTHQDEENSVNLQKQVRPRVELTQNKAAAAAPLMSGREFVSGQQNGQEQIQTTMNASLIKNKNGVVMLDNSNNLDMSEADKAQIMMMASQFPQIYQQQNNGVIDKKKFPNQYFSLMSKVKAEMKSQQRKIKQEMEQVVKEYKEKKQGSQSLTRGIKNDKTSQSLSQNATQFPKKLDQKKIGNSRSVPKQNQTVNQRKAVTKKEKHGKDKKSSISKVAKLQNQDIIAPDESNNYQIFASEQSMILANKTMQSLTTSQEEDSRLSEHNLTMIPSKKPIIDQIQPSPKQSQNLRKSLSEFNESKEEQREVGEDRIQLFEENGQESDVHNQKSHFVDYEKHPIQLQSPNPSKPSRISTLKLLNSSNLPNQQSTQNQGSSIVLQKEPHSKRDVQGQTSQRGLSTTINQLDTDHNIMPGDNTQNFKSGQSTQMLETQPHQQAQQQFKITFASDKENLASHFGETKVQHQLAILRDPQNIMPDRLVAVPQVAPEQQFVSSSPPPTSSVPNNADLQFDQTQRLNEKVNENGKNQWINNRQNAHPPVTINLRKNDLAVYYGTQNEENGYLRSNLNPVQVDPQESYNQFQRRQRMKMLKSSQNSDQFNKSQQGASGFRLTTGGAPSSQLKNSRATQEQFRRSDLPKKVVPSDQTILAAPRHQRQTSQEYLERPRCVSQGGGKQFGIAHQMNGEVNEWRQDGRPNRSQLALRRRQIINDRHHQLMERKQELKDLIHMKWLKSQKEDLLKKVCGVDETKNSKEQFVISEKEKGLIAQKMGFETKLFSDNANNLNQDIASQVQVLQTDLLNASNMVTDREDQVQNGKSAENDNYLPVATFNPQKNNSSSAITTLQQYDQNLAKADKIDKFDRKALVVPLVSSSNEGYGHDIASSGVQQAPSAPIPSQLLHQVMPAASSLTGQHYLKSGVSGDKTPQSQSEQSSQALLVPHLGLLSQEELVNQARLEAAYSNQNSKESHRQMIESQRLGSIRPSTDYLQQSQSRSNWVKRREKVTLSDKQKDDLLMDQQAQQLLSMSCIQVNSWEYQLRFGGINQSSLLASKEIDQNTTSQLQQKTVFPLQSHQMALVPHTDSLDEQGRNIKTAPVSILSQQQQLVPMEDFQNARKVVIFQPNSSQNDFDAGNNNMLADDQNSESEAIKNEPKGIFKETWDMNNLQLSFQNKLCTEALMLKRKTMHYALKQARKRDEMRRERRRSKRFVTKGALPKTTGRFETTNSLQQIMNSSQNASTSSKAQAQQHQSSQLYVQNESGEGQMLQLMIPSSQENQTNNQNEEKTFEIQRANLAQTSLNYRKPIVSQMAHLRSKNSRSFSLHNLHVTNCKQEGQVIAVPGQSTDGWHQIVRKRREMQKLSQQRPINNSESVIQSANGNNDSSIGALTLHQSELQIGAKHQTKTKINNNDTQLESSRNHLANQSALISEGQAKNQSQRDTGVLKEETCTPKDDSSSTLQQVVQAWPTRKTSNLASFKYQAYVQNSCTVKTLQDLKQIREEKLGIAQQHKQASLVNSYHAINQTTSANPISHPLIKPKSSSYQSTTFVPKKEQIVVRQNIPIQSQKVTNQGWNHLEKHNVPQYEGQQEQSWRHRRGKSEMNIKRNAINEQVKFSGSLLKLRFKQTAAEYDSQRQNRIEMERRQLSSGASVLSGYGSGSSRVGIFAPDNQYDGQYIQTQNAP